MKIYNLELNYKTKHISLRTIWKIQMLLPRLWRWWTIQYCEMPSLPDTLWMLLTRFALMYNSMASKIHICCPDQGSCNLSEISWTIRLWYYDQLCLHLLNNNFFCLLSQCNQSVWTCKACSQIRLHCTFICATFKSYRLKQYITRAPTTIILPP